MRTRFDVEQINATNKEERLTYAEYKKMFKLDLAKLDDDKAEDFFIDTEYEFADGKKRPLIVLGTTPEWLPFVRSQIRQNKLFGAGACTLSKKGEKQQLLLEAKKGKVSDSKITKAIKLYPPDDDIVYEIGENKSEKAEAIAGPEGKKGFKLIGKTTFEEIKENLAELNGYAANDYDARSSEAMGILGLISSWLSKHGESKDKNDVLKAKELRALEIKLKKMVDDLDEKRLKDNDRIHEDFLIAQTLFNRLNSEEGDKLMPERRRGGYMRVVNFANEWLIRYQKLDTDFVKDLRRMAEGMKEDAQKAINEINVGFGTGQVVNADKGDKVIDEATRDIVNSRTFEREQPLRTLDTDNTRDEDFKEKKHKKDVLPDEADFSVIGNDAPIVILAHGSDSWNRQGSGKIHATHFANKTPKQILEFIIKAKLPKTYAGVIYLDGCYTAAGNTPKNFAHTLYKALVKLGYHYLQVKGNLGVAATQSDGSEMVTHAEEESRAKQLEKGIKKLGEKRISASKEAKENSVAFSFKDSHLTALKNQIAKESNSVEKEKLEKELEEQTLIFKKELARLDGIVKEIRAPFDEKIKDMTDELERIKRLDFVGTFGPEKLLR